MKLIIDDKKYNTCKIIFFIKLRNYPMLKLVIFNKTYNKKNK
jgi:hypothetical protein